MFTPEELDAYKRGNLSDDRFVRIVEKATTIEERLTMAKYNLSVASIQRGRWSGGDDVYNVVVSLCKAWNKRAGFELFIIDLI